MLDRLNGCLRLRDYNMAITHLQTSSREISDRETFVAELEKIPVSYRNPVAFIRPHTNPLKKGELWDLCLKIRYTEDIQPKSKGAQHYYVFIDNKSASEWCENTARDMPPALRKKLMRPLKAHPTEHRHFEGVFGSSADRAKHVYLYVGNVGFYSTVLDENSILLGMDCTEAFFGPAYGPYDILFTGLSSEYFDKINNPGKAEAGTHHHGERQSD
jgi:hypothetical protein